MILLGSGGSVVNPVVLEVTECDNEYGNVDECPNLQ